jgi:hypothetical protein
LRAAAATELVIFARLFLGLKLVIGAVGALSEDKIKKRIAETCPLWFGRGGICMCLSSVRFARQQGEDKFCGGIFGGKRTCAAPLSAKLLLLAASQSQWLIVRAEFALLNDPDRYFVHDPFWNHACDEQRQEMWGTNSECICASKRRACSRIEGGKRNLQATARRPMPNDRDAFIAAKTAWFSGRLKNDERMERHGRRAGIHANRGALSEYWRRING